MKSHNCSEALIVGCNYFNEESKIKEFIIFNGLLREQQPFERSSKKV
jgi:hypothetical protein